MIFAKLAIVLRLYRVQNCVAAGAATLIGAVLGQTGFAAANGRSLRAAVVIFLLVGATNAYNDVVDQLTDGARYPHRPLPAQQVTRAGAKVAAYTALLLAAAVAATLGPVLLLIAVVQAWLGLVYSKYLKSTVLIGNALVGALSGSTVLVGAISVGSPNLLAISATGVIALYVLAYEILGTIEDIDGDSIAGLTTVATRYGRVKATHYFVAAFGLFVLAVLAFLAGGWLSGANVVIFSLGLIAPLAIAVLLALNGTSRDIDRASIAAKTGWFVSLPLFLLTLQGS